jgi:ribose-phosphate pyrophosphokinase
MTVSRKSLARSRQNRRHFAIIDKLVPSRISGSHDIIGDIKGNCIIIDDMVDTGGTLIEAAIALKNAGAKSIVACCTHAVVSGNAVARLTDSPIEKLYITDTIDNSAKNLSDKFVILSVAELLGESILRIHTERSVSTLFD